jgi:prepilin peptidase CpaA
MPGSETGIAKSEACEVAMLEAVILVVFPFCMAHAAISDLTSMTIANRVSVLLVTSFALVAPMTGMEWSDYGWHFAAGLLVLAVTFVLFALGTMGGGDAKLMAATALWMGFGPPLLDYLVMTALAGGVLTLFLLLYRGSALAVYGGSIPLLRHLSDSSAGIPYGIALGIGGLLAFPASPLMAWTIAQLASN